MTPPKVSIGLPVHNGMPFLAQGLPSLLRQSYADLEVIIGDNASHDGTLEYCRALAERDHRIRILTSDVKLPAPENYRRVFQAAAGRYFKWAAADDACESTYLERCVAVLETHPEVALCYPKTWLIDEQGTQRREYEDQLHLDQRSPWRRLNRLLCRAGRANAVFGVFRREVLAETQLLGSGPSAGLVLLAETALRGQVYEVPERLFLRRLHPDRNPSGRLTQDGHAGWFPAHLGQRRCWRIFRELLGTVQRAPVQRLQRWACYLPVMHWLRRYGQEYLRAKGRGWGQWLLARLPLRHAAEHFERHSTLPGVRH